MIFFERPIFSGKHDGKHEQRDANHGQPGRDAENQHRLGHADVLGDERQPIDKGQIEYGEPTPKRPETVEDCLAVATFGNRPEANRHFLHIIRHGDEDNEDPEHILKPVWAPVCA